MNADNLVTRSKEKICWNFQKMCIEFEFIQYFSKKSSLRSSNYRHTIRVIKESVLDISSFRNLGMGDSCCENEFVQIYNDVFDQKLHYTIQFVIHAKRRGGSNQSCDVNLRVQNQVRNDDCSSHRMGKNK